MADSNWGVNSPEAVKLWSRRLWHESLKQTYISKFMGRDSNSVLQVVEDTSKSEGDRVRCTLRMLLNGDGISGADTLEGNEEALVTFTDDLIIYHLRLAVRSNGRLSEQPCPFSVRKPARPDTQHCHQDPRHH